MQRNEKESMQYQLLVVLSNDAMICNMFINAEGRQFRAKTVINVRFSLLSNNIVSHGITSLKITFVYIDRRENNEYFFYELKISQTKLYWIHCAYTSSH